MLHVPFSIEIARVFSSEMMLLDPLRRAIRDFRGRRPLGYRFSFSNKMCGAFYGDSLFAL